MYRSGCAICFFLIRKKIKYVSTSLGIKSTLFDHMACQRTSLRRKSNQIYALELDEFIGWTLYKAGASFFIDNLAKFSHLVRRYSAYI